MLIPDVSGHWCPGSTLPTVCCSELLNGRVDQKFARGGLTKSSEDMHGYGESLALDGEMSFKECFIKCQVRSPTSPSCEYYGTIRSSGQSWDNLDGIKHPLGDSVGGNFVFRIRKIKAFRLSVYLVVS